jgi:hypothetical protein
MISYLTHDEVNAQLAEQLARQLGSNLTVLSLKDVDRFISTDLLLIDLDHLPPECRSHLFDLVGKGGRHRGLSVHSYRLSRAEVRTLRAGGVAVARRLTGAFLSSRVNAGVRGGPAEKACGVTESAGL